MTKKNLLAAASIASLALLAVGLSSAQSGSRRSGTAPPTRTVQQEPAVARAPQMIALSFHADWCRSCQALEPKLKSAMKAVSKDPFLFVQVDQTDKKSRQAEYLVASLGLSKLWKEYGGRTGFTLLVDPESGRVTGRLTSEQDVKSMTSTLRAALER